MGLWGAALLSLLLCASARAEVLHLATGDDYAPFTGKALPAGCCCAAKKTPWGAVPANCSWKCVRIMNRPSISIIGPVLCRLGAALTITRPTTAIGVRRLRCDIVSNSWSDKDFGLQNPLKTLNVTIAGSRTANVHGSRT